MIGRITSGFLKGSAWVCLLALVLVAGSLLAGRLLVWSVASDQERVQALLRGGGLPFVRVGDVSGSWQVHDPIFTVSDLAFRPGGATALEIDRIELRIDALRSLLHRGPVVTELVVSGIRFTLEHHEGGFRIRGFPDGGELDLSWLLDSIPHLEQLHLSGIDVEVAGPGPQLTLTGDEPWTVTAAAGGQRHLSLPVYLRRELPDGAVRTSRANLTGYYRGDVREADFMAALYLEAPRVALADLPLPAQVSGSFDTRVWLNVGPGDFDLSGVVQVADVRRQEDGRAQSLADEFAATFRYRGRAFDKGVLAIPRLSLKRDTVDFDLAHLSLAVDARTDEPRLAGLLSALDVSPLAGLIGLVAPGSLIPERVRHAITAVAPAGELHQLAFVSSFDLRQMQVAGQLRDFSMGAYLGLPAIDRLNGFVSLQPREGYVDVDNSAFNVHFSRLFAEAWPFDSGRGRMAYRFDDGQLKVSSGLVELTHGDLSVHGKVSLNLPANREQQTWGMTLGITDVTLLQAHRYLPKTLSPALADWLNAAVLGGVSAESGLTIHGALSRQSPRVSKARDFYFKVRDGSINYHPDWPSLEAVSALVHVSNDFVRSGGATGRLYQSDVAAADVHVPIDRDGKTDGVRVVASLSGPFADGVRALQETPLAQMTADVAARWRGDGAMDTEIRLDLPLGLRAGEETGADVRLRVADSRLEMADLRLEVSDLGGILTWNNEAGLSADKFSGLLFGGPIEGRITTELNGIGGEVAIYVDGSADAASLYHWSDQILLSRAAGKLNYQASVHLPYGGARDEAWVEARSDLVGVTLELPHPLSKPDPLTVRDFRYRQTFREPGYLELALDEQIRASLKIVQDLAVGGRIHFGDQPFGAVTYDAIRVSGQLDYLSYEDWMRATGALGDISDLPLDDRVAEHVAAGSLTIGKLAIFNLALEDVAVAISREEGAWAAQLNGNLLDGRVRIPDDDTAPLDIRLQRLRLTGGDGDDPLRRVNPLDIPDIDFSTERLLLDDKDYGSWSFMFRASEDLAGFENLTAKVPGFQVLPGSRVTWRYEDERHSSTFQGGIQVDNLAQALKRFGLASSIEGEGLKISADVGWVGSPATVNVRGITGRVGVEEGRGRFVQAEAGGALKLLGIFDFASIARRFRLDFSDLVEKGFEFDDIAGVASFSEGAIEVREPIVIEGSGGRFTVGGSVDLNTRLLDNDMIVTLPVSSTLPWYAAYSAAATGPLSGAGVLIARWVFEDQIDQMSSARYRISGTIEEPDIEFVAIFDDKLRETSGAGAVEVPGNTEAPADKCSDEPCKAAPQGQGG